MNRFLLHVVTVVLLVARSTAVDCGSCPICDHSRNARMCTSWLPSVLTLSANDKHREFHRCLQSSFTSRIVGQDSLKKKVLEQVSLKLRRPDEPLVLHFAGDNGVGKTMLAKEISLATSLRAKTGPICGPRPCDYGENMLVISCPSYVLMPPDQAAARITSLVVEHSRLHPNGIVLLDDSPTLSEHVISAIAPLLGTATAFPLHQDVYLGAMLVILTSDFGKEGRTRGRSEKEIQLLIGDQLKTIYNYTNVKYVKTFGFMPFDTQAARELVKLTVKQTPCRFPESRVTSASITDGALDAIIQNLNDAGSIVSGNGRAISAAIVEEVDVKVSSYLAENGADLAVEVMLTESHDGGLALRVEPVAERATDKGGF